MNAPMLTVHHVSSSARAAVIVVAMLFVAAPAAATPILVPTGGDGVYGSIFVDTQGDADPGNDIFTFDTRGFTGAVAGESPTSMFLGNAYIAGLGLPANEFFMASDASTQDVKFVLTFPGALLQGGIWQVAPTAGNGPVADLALVGFVGNVLLQFSQICGDRLPNGAPNCLFPYGDSGQTADIVSPKLDALDDTRRTEDPIRQVPEPGTLLLVGSGMAAALAARRQRRR